MTCRVLTFLALLGALSTFVGCADSHVVFESGVILDPDEEDAGPGISRLDATLPSTLDGGPMPNDAGVSLPDAGRDFFVDGGGDTTVCHDLDFGGRLIMGTPVDSVEPPQGGELEDGVYDAVAFFSTRGFTGMFRGSWALDGDRVFTIQQISSLGGRLGPQRQTVHSRVQVAADVFLRNHICGHELVGPEDPFTAFEEDGERFVDVHTSLGVVRYRKRR